MYIKIEWNLAFAEYSRFYYYWFIVQNDTTCYENVEK